LVAITRIVRNSGFAQAVLALILIILGGFLAWLGGFSGMVRDQESGPYPYSAELTVMYVSPGLRTFLLLMAIFIFIAAICVFHCAGVRMSARQEVIAALTLTILGGFLVWFGIFSDIVQWRTGGFMDPGLNVILGSVCPFFIFTGALLFLVNALQRTKARRTSSRQS